MTTIADVAVVGAGVVGCAVASTLTRLGLSVVLVEAKADVGAGTSKANTAIWHTGFDAKPGTLRIVPPDARLPELEQDYRKMQEMIFGEPPSFERLLEVLREIERHVNGS